MNFLETLILYKKFLKHNKIFMDDQKILYEFTIEKSYNWTKSKFNEKLSWYQRIKKKNKSLVTYKNLNELNGWNFRDNKELAHKSKKFFSVIGISIKNASREVNSWDQPFIKQHKLNGGIIGLVRKKIKGVPHYLVEAKFEPGNFNKIQISPSVQATYSNINRIHHGKANKILNFYFKNMYTTISKTLVTEDGGRFYKKRNLHWIINTKKKCLDLPENFRWLTLWEISKFIKKRSMVSPHLRAILSLI